MQIFKHPEREAWKEILSRPVIDTTQLINQIKPILDEVRKQGNEAVRKYTHEFDQVELDDLSIPESQIINASIEVPEPLKRAIDIARANIEQFHSSQQLQNKVVATSPGVQCWQKSKPIEKVGLYVPGGSAPLISTVLMLGIPAILAGCQEIVLCTPPQKDGNIHPAILYTAQILGISKIYRAGGVQAIAAMAYGTETIPAVYKIFGPGNQYVTMAKMLVSLEGIAIDLPAGPSEVAIMADHTADPVFIVSDLLSQAEHGADSQVLFVTDNENLLEAVNGEIENQLKDLPRKNIAELALKNGRLVLLDNLEDMVEFINAYAPEHLIIMVEKYSEIENRINNAGSVFLGQWTPESAGDYASGTNHTLPTNGFARAYSGVGLYSFQKQISFQEITKQGLNNIGPSIEILAEAEGLVAHKRAVSLRLER
ncbi:MAG: histidinol dehydrogenase [Bacteroidales bacterium]|nr:histidinol dehydrogenase [Bacteroidales bacterium]